VVKKKCCFTAAELLFIPVIMAPAMTGGNQSRTEAEKRARQFLADHGGLDGLELVTKYTLSKARNLPGRVHPDLARGGRWWVLAEQYWWLLLPGWRTVGAAILVCWGDKRNQTERNTGRGGPAGFGVGTASS